MLKQLFSRSLLKSYPEKQIILKDNQFDRLLAGISYQKFLLDSIDNNTPEYDEIKANLIEAITQLNLLISPQQ